MQLLKVLAFFVALFIEMLLSSCPSLLNSCPSFLVILSYSFSLWIARIIFIVNIFVFSWNQIPSLSMMVVYLLFLPTPAVLLFAAARKTPKKPIKTPIFARQPGAFHSAVAAATALTR